MAQKILGLGVDIGSTTTSCVLVEAQLGKDASFVARNRIVGTHIVFQSPISFTPLSFSEFESDMDLPQFEVLLESWSKKHFNLKIDTCGIILTGLASRARNIKSVLEILHRFYPEALVISAQDPRLESWVAWHGSCGALSTSKPDRYFLNLDIGGGTTNLAIGLNGRILATGSYFIGARHFVWSQGKISVNSKFGKFLCENQRLDPGLLDAELPPLILVKALESLVQGEPSVLLDGLVQAEFRSEIRNPVITFSGGVGELIYDRALSERALDSYGDLGVGLALEIRKSPVLNKDIECFQPQFKSRATAIGLGINNTWISGSTLHLPQKSVLPLKNLPLLGRLKFSDYQMLSELLGGRNLNGSKALFLEGSPTISELKEFAEALAKLLHFHQSTHILVLLLASNVGKTLGAYITDWGRRPLNVIVIDEIEPVSAQFVSIGTALESVVPVSYFGFY